MRDEPKTAIINGASQGMGASLVKALLQRGYSIVANSRNITKSRSLVPSDNLASVVGDTAELTTGEKGARNTISNFKSSLVHINNGGIFFTQPFTDYSREDFESLPSRNGKGFIYISPLAIKQMVAQKSGGSIVSITTTLAEHPIAGVNASVPITTKGGLEAITRSLAMKYVKNGIRVNAVALRGR
jgi:NAD(P)-dependent dehydrogenase (short-subunit alcohol dehydrogenase family)